MTSSKTPAPPGDIDPRHVFLTAQEVILRYGRGRIHGYQMLKSPGFPCRVGDRFRLDELIVWAQDVPPASCPAARSRRADQPRHAIRR